MTLRVNSEECDLDGDVYDWLLEDRDDWWLNSKMINTHRYTNLKTAVVDRVTPPSAITKHISRTVAYGNVAPYLMFIYDWC